jgi:hypothetical protein
MDAIGKKTIPTSGGLLKTNRKTVGDAYPLPDITDI